jgi:tetratricopeptide (TPR) repeat protein
VVDLAKRSDGGPELVAAVRRSPDGAREAFRRLLAESVDGAAGTPPAAERLATAFAEAWADDFLIRQLRQFDAWAPDQRRRRVQADSLRRVGFEAYVQFDTRRAIELWRRGARLSASLSDSVGVARSLGNIGAGFYSAGRLDSALYYLERAYDLAVASGDFQAAANAVTNLANVSYDQGKLGRAAGLYRRSLSMRERTGDHRGLAADEHNLGLVSLDLGDYETAGRQFKAAREINRQHGYLSEEANNLIGISDVAMQIGEYDRAAALLREAGKMLQTLGDRAGSAAALHREGLLELRRGAYREASVALSRAVAVFEESGREADAAEARLDAAAAFAAVGELEAALLELELADRLVRSGVGGPRLRADLALASGDLALLLNDFEDAERHYGRAESLYSEVTDERGRAAAAQGAVYLLIARQRYKEAVSRLKSVLRAGAPGSDLRAAAGLHLILGYAHHQNGDAEAARRSLLESARATDR